MSPTQLFKFIVDDRNKECLDEQMEKELDLIQQEVDNQEPATVEDEIAEKVFMQSFIPRSLSQVPNHEEEELKLAGTNRRDEDKKLLHMFTGRVDFTLPGRKSSEDEVEKDTEKIRIRLQEISTKTESVATTNEGPIDDGTTTHDDSEAEFSSTNSESSWIERTKKQNTVAAGEGGFELKKADKDARKEHKRLIKEAKKDKREKKIPKHIKKQHMKKGNQSSRRR
mmetsp:Transcript_21124/g.25706  ORF Transcript_21124/g.25706 Transcript_21124/m.25706 type:complete len:225 (+) Transcript_21124:196-870(+)